MPPPHVILDVYLQRILQSLLLSTTNHFQALFLLQTTIFALSIYISDENAKKIAVTFTYYLFLPHDTETARRLRGIPE